MHIEPLHDEGVAATVARWQYDEWGSGYPDKSFEDFLADVRGAIFSPYIPMVLVAFLNGAPVGTASLIIDDLPSRPDLNPWLASVYVLPKHRNKGIGTKLVAATIGQARRLGIEKLYLFTHDKVPFYKRFGWSRYDVGEFMNQEINIMLKTLSSSAES